MFIKMRERKKKEEIYKKSVHCVWLMYHDLDIHVWLILW